MCSEQCMFAFLNSVAMAVCHESNHLIARYFPEAKTSFHLPQPGLKALPDGWRPVRSLPRVLVGVAH